MKNILIDTDILLDFLFDRKPYADDAAKILTLCENGTIKGYLTAVMLSNIYYLLRKTASHEKVIEKLKQLTEIIDILTIDKNVIIKALNSNFKDFEDAIQNYTAELSGFTEIIITRNFKDYKNSNLIVMTPDGYLNNIQS